MKIQFGVSMAAVWSRFFFCQPSSVHGWTSAFLLAVHRLCGVFEGRLSHFLPRWLRRGWQSAISQGKIPWNTPPWLGIEPGPRGGQTVSYPTELSWLISLSTEDNERSESTKSLTHALHVFSDCLTFYTLWHNGTLCTGRLGAIVTKWVKICFKIHSMYNAFMV